MSSIYYLLVSVNVYLVELVGLEVPQGLLLLHGDVPDHLLGDEGGEDGEEEALLALVLLLRLEAHLQRAPGLQEGLPLGALGQVLGVQPDPVHAEVQQRHGEGVPHDLRGKKNTLPESHEGSRALMN